MSLPVTVLSGFLGSGKTTLLRRLLENRQGWKVAVIVNDMAELNIDAGLVADSLHHLEARLVEMTNGCICCTLRADLLEQVAELARTGRYDYLLIESSGISEPLPVAATFSFPDLAPLAHLDTMVTLVDCSTFFEHYLDEEGKLVDLLVDQIEFADVVVLTKLDLVEEGEPAAIAEVVRRLNPRARVILGPADPSDVLATGLYDPAAAERHQDWAQEVREVLNPSHVPETEEYGISSRIFRAALPFHPERLWKALQDAPDGILRAKGFFWMASQQELMGFWSQAGPSLKLESKGPWPVEPRQELVFIGLEMDWPALDRHFRQALVTEEERDWARLSDPFPAWA